jgi:catechol 2,3-dioxygenase-like lactoylglutathione lyase family enzyme
MKLNHINLVVSNVAETIRLFEKHFNFRVLEIKGDNIIAVLKGEEDFTLVIMADKTNDSVYPEAFHIGFILNNTDEVINMYNKLIADNILVSSEPKKIRDSFGFYFHFGNIMIEVGHY